MYSIVGNPDSPDEKVPIMNPQPETTAPPPPPRSSKKTWIVIGSILAVLAVCLCIVAVIVGLVLGYQYFKDNGLLTSAAVGTWSTTYDWGCSGTGQYDHFYIHTDGTFVDDSASPGTWVLTGSQIALTYEGGTAYTGTLSQNQMSGEMVASDGAAGCWTATRAEP
jgi:hypothetical protein